MKVPQNSQQANQKTHNKEYPISLSISQIQPRFQQNTYLNYIQQPPYILYNFVIIAQMSRRLTGDQNSINSKLLGANIADINIQKFRDLANYKKNKYELQGKINITILKTITNKFSPTVIFTIVLPNQGISKIQALIQCQNIMILNLSKNCIEDLSPIRYLKQLKIVDISQNNIKNFDSFQGLQELVNLKAQGNMIKTISNIIKLNTCLKLKNLHLQALNGQLQNPICQVTNYRVSVLDSLTQISRLDSIPKGMTLSNGSQIKVSKKKQLKIDKSNIGPLYCSKFPTINYVMPSFQGENLLKKSISECKSAAHELEMKLKAAMAF